MTAKKSLPKRVKRDVASNVRQFAKNVKATKSATKKVRRAITKNRKAAPSTSYIDGTQRSYSIRDLPNIKGRTFAQLANSLRKHSDELESLLQPGERWAYEIGSDDNGWSKSYSTFGTMRELIDKLEYGQSGHNPDGTQKSGKEWIEAIKIIKYGRRPRRGDSKDAAQFLTNDEFKKEKRREVKKRVSEQSKITEKGLKLGVMKGRKKVPTKINIIEGLINKVEMYQEQEKAMNKKLVAMQKQLNKLTKATTSKPKKATKKAAKPAKKAVKRAIPKSTKRIPAKPRKQAKKKAAPKSHPVKKSTPKKKTAKKISKNTSKKKGGRR